MLRRVARVIRAVFLVAGCLFLILLPIRWSSVPYAVSSDGGVLVGIYAGSIQFILADPSFGPASVDLGLMDVGEWQFVSDYQSGRLWPGLHHGTLYTIYGIPVTVITLPLWLLAFLCLAWPVISFVIARRRRRWRGFEVEVRSEEC